MELLVFVCKECERTLRAVNSISEKCNEEMKSLGNSSESKFCIDSRSKLERSYMAICSNERSAINLENSQNYDFKNSSSFDEVGLLEERKSYGSGDFIGHEQLE